MAFSLSPKGKVAPSMNVTPLVDVVLVLLIIFMVITPMLIQKLGVRIPEKPEETDADATTHVPVVLSISENGAIRINRDVVSEAELEERLARVFAARGDRAIFFYADDEVAYGRAMDVMDKARAGGAATIAVVTDPLAD